MRFIVSAASVSGSAHSACQPGSWRAGHRGEHADEQAVVGAVVLELVAGVVHQAHQRAVGTALDEREDVVAQRAQAGDPVGAVRVDQQHAQAHLQVGPVERALGGLGGAGQRQAVVVGPRAGDAAQRDVLAEHLVELARRRRAAPTRISAMSMKIGRDCSSCSCFSVWIVAPRASSTAPEPSRTENGSGRPMRRPSEDRGTTFMGTDGMPKRLSEPEYRPYEGSP